MDSEKSMNSFDTKKIKGNLIIFWTIFFTISYFYYAKLMFFVLNEFLNFSEYV